MSVKKSIFMLVKLSLITAIAVFGISFYQRFHIFSVEDEIHSTFYQVVSSLEDYEHDHHMPATKLDQLVPDYLPKLPSTSLVDSVEYAVAGDGKTWRLSLHSRALAEPRVYCHRSDHVFTPEEEKRVIRRYHSGIWTVLRE